MSQLARSPYAFISHASGDVKAAREIVAKLHQHGIETWLAPDDVQPGREFSIQLEEAIAGCMAFVVLMSEKANDSAFVRAEPELAFGKCDIYPVRIADVQPAGGLALFLRLKHWTDAFGPEREANLARLAETIKGMAGAGNDLPLPSPPNPPPPSPPSPPQPLLIVPEPVSPSLALGEEEAMRAWIGDKAPHFLEKWRRMDARKSIVSFSFPGIIFGPFWLFYRKIYKPGLIVAAAAFFLTTFGTFGEAMGEKVILVLVQLISLAVALGIGLFGNHLYRRHVAAQIRLLNLPGSDPQQIRDRLAMSGGTSPAAVAGLFAGLFVANFAMIAVARTCCAPPDPAPYAYPGAPATDASLAPPASEPTATATGTAGAGAGAQNAGGATIWSACLVNDSGFDMTITINPDKADSRQEVLNAGQRTSFSSYSSADPTIRFDADATSGSNLVIQTAITSSVASADQCGRTYRFTSSGDAVSLAEAL